MAAPLVRPLFLLLLLFPAAGFPLEQHCVSQTEISLLAADQSALAEVCHTAERALAFLGRYGLSPKRKIQILIVEEQIDSHGYKAYGSYDSRNDRIQLMSYAAIQQATRGARIYGEPFDRVHYAGAIAHEVAHAVVQHHLKSPPLSAAPQEYLAYATQLAVMPEGRREALIEAMAVEPWSPGDAISDIYMALEPGKFAVKSYSHLTTMAEPEAFVQILLNAKWFYVYVP